MTARLIWIVGLFCCYAASFACLWVDDTLSAEMKGYPGIVDAIVGRLEINPKEYYVLRIKISEARIRKNSADFAAYDNIAVAQDKIGNQEASFKILEAKRRKLVAANIQPTSDPINDPWYRYHANLGTIYAHQWIKENKGEDTSLLKKAISELETAIKINPKAHFGREIVQVRLIKLLQLTKSKGEKHDVSSRLLSEQQSMTKEIEPAALTEGIIGIMALGNGAESVDLIIMLRGQVSSKDGILGYLATYRAAELVKAGKAPMIFEYEPYFDGAQPRENNPVLEQYKVLRKNAVEFQENRNSYILERVKRGSHPDYDPDFWKDYKEIPRPEINKMEPPQTPLNNPTAMLTGIGISSIIGAIALAVNKLYKSKQSWESVADEIL